MTKKFSAQCACGKIKFEVETDLSLVANCHCRDCKRASGGEMATVFGVPAAGFTLLSGTPKAFTYTADSGKKLDRNFCPDCGARLFTSNLEGMPGLLLVAIGSLDHPEGIAPALELFTQRRLDWMKPLDVPQFAGMPG
ncbi:MAG TPA: GFA family protein [Polyangiaceae bacterium]|nr:GFA family protein [Polyangiaceae bacterium]